jgi:hypothetical protein
MKGKKGVVGETITWFGAFLVIFFILFVFFFSSIFIKAGTRVFSFPEEQTSITFANTMPAVMSTDLGGNALELKIMGYFIIEIIKPLDVNAIIYDYIASRNENIYDLLEDYLYFQETKPEIFKFTFVRPKG